MARELSDLGCYASVSYHLVEPLDPSVAQEMGANPPDEQRNLLRKVSIGQMVLESGMGYPRAKPEILKDVIEKLAELKELPAKQVEDVTYLNTRRLFRRLPL